MKKFKIHLNDQEIELNNIDIDFYKKERNKTRASKKGVESFFKRLFDKFTNHEVL